LAKIASGAKREKTLLEGSLSFEVGQIYGRAELEKGGLVEPPETEGK